MKAKTVQTLHRILKERKSKALWSGHYPPPYTAKAFDNRGPVPFRSMGYAQTIIEINALIDAINELTNQPNHDKSMTHQNDTESPQPVAEAESLVGVTSTDLLAFSSILGGLLASGHFTRPPGDDYSDEPQLVRADYGKEWKKDCLGDPRIYRRHVPCALEAAEELFTAALDVIGELTKQTSN